MKVPSSTETEVAVTITLASDGSSPIEGLAETDFVVTSAGASQVPTGITEASPGLYVLTVTALSAGALSVDIFDSGLNLNVVVSSNVLYRGGVSTTIV